MDESLVRHLCAPEVNSTAEVLRRAKALIDRPEKWCKEEYSAADGRAHCVVGAIRVYSPEFPERMDAKDALRRVIGGRMVHDWNDDRRTTHADVMRAFDLAIASAEHEGHEGRSA